MSTLTGTATPIEVEQRLTHGIPAGKLPQPYTPPILDREWRTVSILLGHNHDLTDLHTWIAWLGAGKLAVRVKPSRLAPGHIVRETSAVAVWRGWTITVTWVQVLAADTVREHVAGVA